MMNLPTPIQSIKRALDILDYLTIEGIRQDGISLQDIAQYLDVNAPTAHNIVRTMVSCGYIRRDDAHLYRLGPRCLDLARSSQFVEKILPDATAILSRLSAQIGESVVLVTLLHGRRYPLLRNEGNGVIRVSTMLEDAQNFFALVTGRILAAYATPAELEAIIAEHGFPLEDWAGIDNTEALQQALATIRQAGIAEAGPLPTDIYALAIPVLNHDQQLLGALGCYLPAFRASEERLAMIRVALRDAAMQIAALS